MAPFSMVLSISPTCNHVRATFQLVAQPRKFEDRRDPAMRKEAELGGKEVGAGVRCCGPAPNTSFYPQVKPFPPAGGSFVIASAISKAIKVEREQARTESRCLCVCVCLSE